MERCLFHSRAYLWVMTVHFPFQKREMPSPLGCFREADVFLALPFHRVEQQHAQRRDQTSLANGPGPDRGRHGARDRSGEPEPVSDAQFRGAMETLKVLLC